MHVLICVATAENVETSDAFFKIDHSHSSYKVLRHWRSQKAFTQSRGAALKGVVISFVFCSNFVAHTVLPHIHSQSFAISLDAASTVRLLNNSAGIILDTTTVSCCRFSSWGRTFMFHGVRKGRRRSICQYGCG